MPVQKAMGRALFYRFKALGGYFFRSLRPWGGYIFSTTLKPKRSYLQKNAVADIFFTYVADSH